MVLVLTDMAESLTISITVAAALQDLPDQVLKSIEDTLKTLGAVTANDLQHITEGDFLLYRGPPFAA